jgi:hypothetical protein
MSTQSSYISNVTSHIKVDTDTTHVDNYTNVDTDADADTNTDTDIDTHTC